MSRLIIAAGAAMGLDRCRTFLKTKNKTAAKNAAKAIKHYFDSVSSQPNMGKPLDDSPELRELIIPFGGSWYVVLYRFDALSDVVYLLAFRHQKESGY